MGYSANFPANRSSDDFTGNSIASSLEVNHRTNLSYPSIHFLNLNSNNFKNLTCYKFNPSLPARPPPSLPPSLPSPPPPPPSPSLSYSLTTSPSPLPSLPSSLRFLPPPSPFSSLPQFLPLPPPPAQQYRHN
jgi:hypothetical protein